MRVALHLNLKSLASDTLAKISVSANAADQDAESVSFPAGDTASSINQAFNYNQYLVKNTSNGYGQTKVTLTYDKSKILKSLSFSTDSGASAQSVESPIGKHGTLTGLCAYSVGAQSESGDKRTVELTINNAACNVNISYVTGEETQEYAVTFKTTFSAGATSTQESGLIVYVLRDNGTGSYAEFYSIFVKKDDNEQTFELTLQGDSDYILLVSKPHLWQLTLNGQTDKTRITFTPTATNKTVTIVVSGGDVPNDYICV